MAGQGAGDGQADACAVGVFVQLHELGEDVLGLFWRYADASVFDGECHLTVVPADTKRDMMGVGGWVTSLECQWMSELNCIVEQQCQCLGCRLSVGSDGQ